MYRQPLRSESRLGSVTGPSDPQAVGPASLGNLRRSAPPPPPERRLLGNFMKQPEPLLAAAALFSGLFAMARAIWASTPQQGHGCRLSLGVGDLGVGLWVCVGGGESQSDRSVRPQDGKDTAAAQH